MDLTWRPKPASPPFYSLASKLPTTLSAVFALLLLLTTLLMLWSNFSLGATVVSYTKLGPDAVVNRAEAFQFTLRSSVEKMWAGDAYALAILIVVLSGAWPYAKLLALTILWFAPLTEKRRGRAATAVDLLGKFSLVDGYVLLFMIVGFRLNITVDIIITTITVDVDVVGGWGVYSFVWGALLSLLLSNALLIAHQLVEGRERQKRDDPLSVVATNTTTSALDRYLDAPAPSGVRAYRGRGEVAIAETFAEAFDPRTSPSHAARNEVQAQMRLDREAREEQEYMRRREHDLRDVRRAQAAAGLYTGMSQESFRLPSGPQQPRAQGERRRQKPRRGAERQKSGHLQPYTRLPILCVDSFRSRGPVMGFAIQLLVPALIGAAAVLLYLGTVNDSIKFDFSGLAGDLLPESDKTLSLLQLSEEIEGGVPKVGQVPELVSVTPPWPLFGRDAPPLGAFSSAWGLESLTVFFLALTVYAPAAALVVLLAAWFGGSRRSWLLLLHLKTSAWSCLDVYLLSVVASILELGFLTSSISKDVCGDLPLPDGVGCFRTDGALMNPGMLYCFAALAASYAASVR